MAGGVELEGLDLDAVPEHADLHRAITAVHVAGKGERHPIVDRVRGGRQRQILRHRSLSTAGQLQRLSSGLRRPVAVRDQVDRAGRDLPCADLLP